MKIKKYLTIIIVVSAISVTIGMLITKHSGNIQILQNATIPQDEEATFEGIENLDELLDTLAVDALPERIPMPRDHIYPEVNQTYLELAILDEIDRNIRYDPSYVRIAYPGGDVAPDRGVCTDVIIRVYRRLGIDLQKKVHEDMRANFNLYPDRWGLKAPDTNIDHRRVPNLMKFFSRHGEVLTITDKPEDYKPGNIVCWDLGGGILHIGIVSNRPVQSSEYRDDNLHYILHNICCGQILEDCLFRWKIIGHYNFLNHK